MVPGHGKADVPGVAAEQDMGKAATMAPKIG